MSSAHIKSVQTEKETWHPSDTQIVYFYSIFSYFLFTKNPGIKKRKSPKTLEALGLFPLVGEDGFEPSKRNAADLQSVPFGHSGTPPYEIGCSGACLEPVDGLEPPTYWLQISCSTDWAIPAAQTEHAYYSTGSPIVKHYFSKNAKIWPETIQAARSLHAKLVFEVEQNEWNCHCEPGRSLVWQSPGCSETSRKTYVPSTKPP